MDLAINNGFVIDPKHQVFCRLNIGVSKGRVQELTLKELHGDETVDAGGLVVTPGFIDSHVHEGDYLPEKGQFDTGIFECLLRMGVTTAIGGNCGEGPDEPDRYLDAVDKYGIPINLGLLVPHHVLRDRVKAGNKYLAVDNGSIAAMRDMAEHYLKSGCLGISFGIRYIPGIDKRELHGICEAAVGSGKVVAAHIRDDAENVMPSAMELIELAEKYGIPIELSHIGSMAGYGQMERLLMLIDSFRASGIDVYSDCYPYNAFSTCIGETTYDDGFLERYSTSYESIEIAEGTHKGERCSEELFRKLRAEAPDTITIAHVMRETEVNMAIAHPGVLIGSDGFLHKGQGHPRAAGTFPRIIKRYVIEKKLLSINEAVEKMTWKAAKRFGLDRGNLGAGSAADIVAFDLEGISDNASFDDPTLPPAGIKYVILGGKIALKDGVIMDGKLGKAIRKL